MFENQHLVTEAILRRWTDGATKLLDVYQIDTGLTSTKSPREVCAVENFIHDDPAKAERLWSKHETRLGAFDSALTEETFFGDPGALRTARAMLALHAVRSYTGSAVSARARAAAAEKTAHELVAKYPNELFLSVLQRTRLALPMTYDVLLAEARGAVERNTSSIAPGGAFFRDGLFRHFSEARRLMKAQGGLEVLVPANPHSEFVIADDPVIIPARDMDGRFGPLQGVPWSQAKTFFMPFSPCHVIAVGPSNIWRPVDDDAVDWLNRNQLGQARRHLVTRPGSGLVQWAAETRRAGPQAA